MRAIQSGTRRRTDAPKERTRRPVAALIDPVDPFLLEETTWTARELRAFRTSNPVIVVRHRAGVTG